MAGELSIGPELVRHGGSKFFDNLGLLHHSSLESAAHLVRYGEAAFGVGALAVGTQVLSGGLRAGLGNPLAIETGVHLVSHAAAAVPHIVIGMAVVEAGFWTGAAMNAGISVLDGSCD